MVQHNLARFNANLIPYEFSSLSEYQQHGGIHKIMTDSLTNNFVFLITLPLFYTVHQSVEMFLGYWFSECFYSTYITYLLPDLWSRSDFSRL